MKEMEETERLGRRRLAPQACPQGLGCAATLLNLEGTVSLVCQTRWGLPVGIGAGNSSAARRARRGRVAGLQLG